LLLLACLLAIVVSGQAQGGECDDVNIPIIGVALLKEVNSSYSRKDIQGAIGKLETFITLNRAQLAESDEPLSDEQKHCIGRLVDEHNFRLAHLHQINGQRNKAEEILRDILFTNPDHYNARLALAQIQAGRKDFISALYHLRFALGGMAPKAVHDDILSILSIVNQTPIRFFNVFAALAPDTNINRATQNREIDLDINGTSLPFILGDDSLASSGIGVVLSANARYETPISRKLLLRLDGVGSWLNFRGQQFDDLFLRSQSGFRWLYDNGSVSSQVVLARQWHAGAGFATILGGRLGWEHNLLSIFRYGASFEQTWQTHDVRKDLDGPESRINVFSTYQLTASSLVNASFTWTGRSAKIRRFGYNQEAINLGYVRELPWGLTINLNQFVSLRDHKDIEPFFVKNRTDVFSRSLVQGTKRDLSIWGLVPVISYGFSRNFSNIDFFSYTRHQVQFGFTKLF